MTVREFKDKIFEEYTDAIGAIEKASREMRDDGEHKVDVGVATDKFIAFVDNSEYSIFVNIPEAKMRIGELRAQLTED